MKFSKIKNIENGFLYIQLGFLVLMIVVITMGTLSYERNNNVLSTDSIEYTIEKYAIACYATEGSYPPDLKYLEDHYGLILDTKTYRYYYEVFGSNVMPSVTVIKKN